MTNLPNWLHAALGPAAADAVPRIASAINAAHQRGRRAQESSGLTQLNPYGTTRWLAVYAELCDQLRPLDGYADYNPPHAPYKIPVLNRTALLPIRRSTDLGAPLQDLRISITRVQRHVIRLGDAEAVPTALDFTSIVDDEDEDWLTADLAPRDARVERVMYVPYINNAHAGLLALALGDGAVRRDGGIDWQHFHRVDLSLYSAAPQPVLSETEQVTFASGTAPDPDLRRRTTRVDEPEVQDTIDAEGVGDRAAGENVMDD